MAKKRVAKPAKETFEPVTTEPKHKKPRPDIQALDQPNRRTFEQLLREIGRHDVFHPYDYPDDERELYNRIEARKKALLKDDAELQVMEKQLDEMTSARSNKRQHFKKKLEVLRHRYQAHGMTKAVIEAAQRLVDELYGTESGTVVINYDELPKLKAEDFKAINELTNQEPEQGS